AELTEPAEPPNPAPAPPLSAEASPPAIGEPALATEVVAVRTLVEQPEAAAKRTETANKGRAKCMLSKAPGAAPEKSGRSWLSCRQMRTLILVRHGQGAHHRLVPVTLPGPSAQRRQRANRALHGARRL